MAALTRIGLGISRTLTRLFILAQRVLGLVGTADQLLLHADHPQPVALVVSGCLLAGAQATETVILSAIDRLVGEHAKVPPREVAVPAVDPPSGDGGSGP